MGITTPDAAAELAGLPAGGDGGDVAAAMREGLLAFSTAAGLVVMQQMLAEELASIVGPKHAKRPDRVGNWQDTTSGQVVLGSQKVTVTRPRGRFVDGGEVELATWEAFAESIGPIAGKATSRSAGSRRFKAAT